LRWTGREGLSWNAVVNTIPELSGSRDAPHIFRAPLGMRLLLLFGVVFLALVSGIMVGFAAAGFAVNWALGLFVTAVAVFMLVLTRYVWRDCKGKWGLRVELEAYAAKFDLPSGRSLIHRPPTQHLTISYADIEAIEMRLEAYRSQGMAIMQRAYVLRRKSGELIFLFEERALATPFAVPMSSGIVAELVAKAGVKLRDLGMVEGRGGLLGAWGTHAPEWAAPSLSPARQRQLWRRAAATGALAVVAATAPSGAWLGGLLRRSRKDPGSKPP
jgi:hypothetical protein